MQKSQIQIVELYRYAKALAHEVDATIFLQTEHFRIVIDKQEDYLVCHVGALVSYLEGYKRGLNSEKV